MNEVAYQPGYSDQFYHRYSYDAENKLIKVFTSPDRVVWEQEADYNYYRHGPLARVELGQVGVQGVDYAYTLQGWLKTVNSTAVTSAADMGGDGTLSGRKIAADVYGFALHYNSTDYKAINLSKTVVAPVTSTALPAFKDLYNGNIAAMAVTFKHTSFGANNTSGLNQPLLYKYRYDQLNRIKEMDAYGGLNQTTNAWSFGSPLTAYQERVSYDGNGNILTYTRNGDAARTAMDNMTYSYVSGTNKLDKVVDAAADAIPANYPNYNDLKTGQASGNYAYDAIGNLIKDASEGISSGGIVWNVYGKIASVTKNGVTTSYTYDASGNRISKTTGGKTTWYVRDASGNVMAVYESGNAAVNGGNLSQIEVHLYGSSRLGMWTPNRNVQVIPSAQNTTMIGVTNGVGVTRTYKRGLKFFELSNHLGNVLVTVTDRKVAIQNGTTGTILNYVADVVSGGDYYPFGMQMPSRNYSVDKYRFGFNGKEKDKDLNSLTAYDYGFRIYNPAIGKFLSVDPLMDSYPWYSPYHYAGGNPIKNIDLDGAEPLDYVYKWVGTKMLINDKRRVDNEVERDDYLGVYSYSAVYDKVTEKHWFIMKKSGDPTFYYWKHKDGADPNRLIQSTSGKQDNGIWAPFKTRGQIDAEQGAAIARGMSTFFVAVFTAPFVYIGASGLVTAVSASVHALTVKTVTYIYSAYWKNAVWIGALGRTLAELLDETGSLNGLGSSGGILFNKAYLFERYAEHIFTQAHIKDGIMKLGNSKDEILESIGKVVEDNILKLKEGDNLITTRINNVITQVKTFVKDGIVFSIDAWTGQGNRQCQNEINLLEEINKNE